MKGLGGVDHRDGLLAEGLPELVGDIRGQHHELPGMLAIDYDKLSDRVLGPTCGCGPGFAAVGRANASSDISSSISVVSVPLLVTGDGPTMSLGLMRLRFVDGIRWMECGRSDCESTELVVDLGDRMIRSEARPELIASGAYIVMKGEWRAPVSGDDTDMSWCRE
jgi:hypothetical protein